MRILSLTTIFILLLFTSCKKDHKTGQYTLHFQMQLDGSDVGLNCTYLDTGGVMLKVELLQFYIANITFIEADGSETVAEDIALVRFDDNGSADVTFNVHKGEYEKIKFGIGVPKDLNEADPSNYNDEGNPLNTTEGTYWGWASMYRFASIQGRYDLEPDGTYDGTFAYHTGFEDSYREVTFDNSVKIEKKGEYTLGFNVDVYKILTNPGNEVDVVNHPNYHGNTADFYLSTMISDNLRDAISLQ